MKKITLYVRIVSRTDRICFHLYRLYHSENRMHAVTRVSAYVTNACNPYVTSLTVNTFPRLIS